MSGYDWIETGLHEIIPEKPHGMLYEPPTLINS